MYKKVNKITGMHFKVLSLFTKGFENDFYIREVNNVLGISPRTAQLILNDLENKSVLESKLRGKIKTYKLKTTFIAKEYLILTENYKKIRFFEKKVLIKQVIEAILPLIDGIVAIFGSYVKDLEKEGSDLDIFVVGSYKRQKIKDIANTYGIKINIKQYPLNIFMDNKKDVLIKEVVDNHILVRGTEQFIDLTAIQKY